jgi:hypothetical protein
VTLAAIAARADTLPPSPAGGSRSRVARGGLEKEVIRAVVRRHLGEVQACYQALVDREPEQTGRIRTQFTIGPDGHVPTAAVVEDTLYDEGVKSCIERAIASWRFPRPVPPGPLVVIYPFSFILAK